MEYIVIGILSIGCITLGFTTFNLLRKVEKMKHSRIININEYITLNKKGKKMNMKMNT